MYKALRNILKFCYYASFVPVFMLLVVTTLDVGARYIFNSSISSALEICSMLLSMGISLALGYIAIERENFSVTFLVDRLPAKAKIVLNAVTYLISAGICYILVTQAAKRALYSLKVGEYIGALLKIYVSPAKFLFAFGFLLAALACTVQFLGSLRGKDGEPGEKGRGTV